MKRRYPDNANVFETKNYFERRLKFLWSESGQYEMPERAVW
jgi:hypothetical protein